jgi:hypothetical protein
MATLAALQADLDKLKRARRSGVLRLRLDERDVWYKSDAEMANAIAALENEIGALTGSNEPRTIAVRSEKGWL